MQPCSQKRNPVRTDLLTALLTLSTLLAGQTPPETSPQPPASTDKTASIEGVVHNASTGEPIPHVHVILRGIANGTQRQYGAMTAQDGKFSITSLVPGSYSVAAERAGFVVPTGAAGRNQVRLQADEKKTDFDLKMTPTGQITGRVTDAAGEPVEGASVTAVGGNSNG